MRALILYVNLSRACFQALAAWREEVQTAEAEATRLWSVVQTEGSVRV